MEYPKITAPATIVISAPSQAGKTQFLLQLVQNQTAIYNRVFDRIFLFYSVHQPIYDEFQKSGAVLVQGLPCSDYLKFNDGRHTLALFDDLMHKIAQQPDFVELIFRDAHHSLISPVILIQNLYFKNLRTIRMNTQAFVFLKNPSDTLAIQTFARQVFPKNSQFFIEAFNDCTEKPFGYLFVDLSVRTPDCMRLRTNLFPHQWPVLVYSKSKPL